MNILLAKLLHTSDQDYLTPCWKLFWLSNIHKHHTSLKTYTLNFLKMYMFCSWKVISFESVNKEEVSEGGMVDQF